MGYQGSKEERYEKNRAAQVKYLSDPTKKAAHYARVAARNKVLRAEVTRLIRERKAVPCQDCGESYPYYVMDFDHVRGEKSFGIGTASGRVRSIEAVLAEIEKCDVICANCHRERTHQRRSIQAVEEHA